jgi:hypothetical protein
MSTTNMDPFDEFEFKPLTDGLGFHKKTVNLREELKSAGVLHDELKGIPSSAPQGLFDETPSITGPSKRPTFEDVLSSLEKTPLKRPAELEFSEPLPRDREVDKPVQSPFPRSEAFKGPNPTVPQTPPAPIGNEITKNKTKGKSTAQVSAKAGVDVGTRRGAADSPKRNLAPATVSVPSAFLDFVIVVAMSLIFLIMLLSITKVDLNVVLKNVTRDLMTQISLGVMFLSVMQMYVVIARSFFGRTLGEWTFDLQMGEDDQQKKESYPLRVVWRSLIINGTGIFLLTKQ